MRNRPVDEVAGGGPKVRKGRGGAVRQSAGPVALVRALGQAVVVVHAAVAAAPAGGGPSE